MPRFCSALCALPFLLACGGTEERPPPFVASGGSGASGATFGGGITAGDDEECETAEEIDTSRLCGSQVVPVVVEKPNIYFVLDNSGSMEELISNTQTKADAAQKALVSLAKELGHRIEYGLAIYPDPDDNGDLEGCAPGLEVFETQEGDVDDCAEMSDGSVLRAFTSEVFQHRPLGGTPLASTLFNLAPTILTLEGRTSVVLVTDGAPNCNADADCTADECTFNIEEVTVDDVRCDETYNCCDSDIAPANSEVAVPEAWCVDSQPSLDEVAMLREAGITTYVVGVPGTEHYADLMNRLARAGGTARGGDIDYYDTRDVEELNDALLQIGSEVTQSCEVELDEPPDNPDLLNVYLDAELLAADPENGWVFEDEMVQLLGTACERVESGEVNQIQIVEGCETVIK